MPASPVACLHEGKSIATLALYPVACLHEEDVAKEAAVAAVVEEK
jgi:hypothetical protein